MCKGNVCWEECVFIGDVLSLPRVKIRRGVGKISVQKRGVRFVRETLQECREQTGLSRTRHFEVSGRADRALLRSRDASAIPKGGPPDAHPNSRLQRSGLAPGPFPRAQMGKLHASQRVAAAPLVGWPKGAGMLRLPEAQEAPSKLRNRRLTAVGA